MANAERVVGYEFYQEFTADIESRRVLRRGEQLPIPLTPKEFEVLEFFLKNPRKVIPRESVEPLKMPSIGRIPTDNYLSRIAIRLGLDKDILFESIRGVGYSLKVNVRLIYASDQQEGGEAFKVSELHFNTHTVDSMRVSLKHSLRALDLNPHGLPEAHVTAAFNYINLSMAAYSAEPPNEVIPRARQHAQLAFKADSKSSRALGVLGLISLIYDYDWDRAREQFEAALKLDPNDSATLLSYAHYLVGAGRHHDAVDAVERAARIDPTDLIIHASVGWIHLLAGDVPGAIEQGEKTQYFYPNFPPGHVILGWAYEAAERYPEARRHFQISLEKEYSPAALASLGHLEAMLGDRSSGEAALAELEKLYERRSISYVPAYCRALIFAGLNESENCLNALQEAYQQHCDWLIHLEVERRWDPVRNSDGFRSIVQKVLHSAPLDRSE
jgi:tetratricopeptide (TPR) repeat protein